MFKSLYGLGAVPLKIVEQHNIAVVGIVQNLADNFVYARLFPILRILIPRPHHDRKLILFDRLKQGIIVKTSRGTENVRHLFCDIEYNLLGLADFFYETFGGKVFQVMMIERMIGDFMSLVYLADGNGRYICTRLPITKKKCL